MRNAALLAALLASQAAGAQTDDAPAPAPAPVAPGDPTNMATPGRNAARREAVDSELGIGGSERARQDKLAGVAFAAGMPIAPIPGYGVSLYFHALPDLQIGLESAIGKVNLKKALKANAQTEVRAFELETSLTQLYARWFVGNSFNLSLGLGRRQVESTLDIRAAGVDAGLAGTITATTTTASLRLGNHWSWESGFTLGIDWVGYTLPLGAKSTAEVATTGAAPQTDELAKMKKDAEDAAAAIGEAGTISLVMLSLGFAF